jgi:hypothetical protein
MAAAKKRMPAFTKPAAVTVQAKKRQNSQP